MTVEWTAIAATASAVAAVASWVSVRQSAAQQERSRRPDLIIHVPADGNVEVKNFGGGPALDLNVAWLTVGGDGRIAPIGNGRLDPGGVVHVRIDPPQPSPDDGIRHAVVMAFGADRRGYWATTDHRRGSIVVGRFRRRREWPVEAKAVYRIAYPDDPV